MRDLIILNARIITMDPAVPEASCVVVRDGRVVEVDPIRPWRAARAGARKVDLHGRTLLPGFIDAHCHVAAFAESLVSLDLSRAGGVDSIAAMQERIRNSCKGRVPGAWVRGKGYHEFYLAEKRHPCRQDIDSVAPAHPVKLSHRSGHAHVLNTLALELVGITDESGDPPGGMIDRALDTGEPTGILYGMGDYLSARIPPAGEEEIDRGMEGANEWLLSRGITSVQDATAHNGIREWRRFERWKRRGMLKPRITMMMGLDGFREWKKGRYPAAHIGQDWLKLGAVKIIVDEATGRLHPDQTELNRMVLDIHLSDLQVAIHAIEESVIEAACDAVAQTLHALPRRDHRHRVEHCSVCPPSLVRRLYDLGIAVSTQPAFLFHSGDRYLSTVPEKQRQHLYPVGSMTRGGLLVAFGTDAPIAGPDPLVGVRAAVDRTSSKGQHLLPDEGIEVSEALMMHTACAAKAAFEEEVKGSIAPGKMADFVVLSGDPRELDSDRLKDIKVDVTIIGGEIVWERPRS